MCHDTMFDLYNFLTLNQLVINVFISTKDNMKKNTTCTKKLNVIKW